MGGRDLVLTKRRKLRGKRGSRKGKGLKKQVSKKEEEEKGRARREASRREEDKGRVEGEDRGGQGRGGHLQLNNQSNWNKPH